MTVYFSAMPLYQYHSLQDFITFLAIVSSAIWIAVLFTTLLRLTARIGYKRKSKRFEQDQS